MNRGEGILSFLQKKKFDGKEVLEDSINFNVKHGDELSDEKLDQVHNGNVTPEEDLLSEEELDDLMNGNVINNGDTEDTKKVA